VPVLVTWLMLVVQWKFLRSPDRSHHQKATLVEDGAAMWVCSGAKPIIIVRGHLRKNESAAFMSSRGDFDLSCIWREKRFLGVRVALFGLTFASVAFALACFGHAKLSMSMFVIGMVFGGVGLFMHISRMRN
jgi:hypothetical protein